MTLELNKVGKKLAENLVTIEVTEAATSYLGDKGYDAEFGARPLRRLIQNQVEDALSDGILSGRFPEGSRVLIDAKDGKLDIRRMAEGEVAPPADAPVLSASSDGGEPEAPALEPVAS